MASCNKCGQAASLLCKHVNLDGTASATRYCSPACQRADWTTHKEECKNSKHRKKLYAAGHFLQQVFFLLREVGFEQEYERLEKAGDGRLHIYGRWADPDRFLFPFPSNFDLSLQEKKAILSHLACNDVFHMSRLLDRIIKGTHVALHELTVKIKMSRRYIVHHYAGGNIETRDFNHHLFSVSLKDGNEYVIDLAGAQYGQCQTVMPMRAFYSDWVSASKDPEPIGGLRDERCRLLEKSNVCDMDQDLRSMIVQDKIAIKLETLVEEWEQAKGITVDKLIHQEAAIAELTPDRLLDFVRSELQGYVQQALADDTFAFERLSGYDEPTFKLR